jgi:hypothetical protein
MVVGKQQTLGTVEDVVRKGKCILDLIVQGPHEGRAFGKVVLLNLGSIVLEFHVIDSKLALCVLEHPQLSFCFCHAIWIPESRFQHRHQGWGICNISPHIGDVGLDLRKGLAH